MPRHWDATANSQPLGIRGIIAIAIARNQCLSKRSHLNPAIAVSRGHAGQGRGACGHCDKYRTGQWYSSPRHKVRKREENCATNVALVAAWEAGARAAWSAAAAWGPCASAALSPCSFPYSDKRRKVMNIECNVMKIDNERDEYRQRTWWMLFLSVNPPRCAQPSAHSAFK